MSSGRRWWRDFRAQLALVVLGGLLLRVFAVLTWSSHLDPKGDQAFYWRSGQDLGSLIGFVYRNNFGERVATGVHPPLYSAYLGVVSFLGGGSPTAMRMATTVLGALTVLVVGLAARRIAGERVGIVAAGLAAVYPNLWFNDVQLQSESVYALTISLVLVASYRFRDDRTYSNAAFLGLVIALAALARAEALALFVLLAVPLVLLKGKRPADAPRARDLPDDEAADPAVAGFWERADTGVGARLRMLGVVALVGIVVTLPWVVRNLLSFEKPAIMSTGAGYVIEISNCDQTYGLAPPLDSTGLPKPDESADKFLGYWSENCDRTPWPPGDETAAEAAKRKTGLDYMASHKGELPKVMAARAGRIWDLWRPQQNIDFNVFFESRTASIDVLGRSITFQWLGLIQYYVMLPLSVVGLVSMWRRKVTIIPFVAIAISVTLTAAVSFGITRYRVGADVAICILAAVGVDAIVRAIAGRRRPPSMTHRAGPEPADDTHDGELISDATT